MCGQPGKAAGDTECAITVSTHVLDGALGAPAAGVRVSLYRGDELVGAGETGPDGRIGRLAESGLEPGAYRLLFEVGAYWDGREHLFESISLGLNLDRVRHYHVPLLLSPFSCATYRGT